MRRLTAVLGSYKRRLKKFCSERLKSGDSSAASAWVLDNYNTCSGSLKAAIGYLRRENAGYLLPLFRLCIDFFSEKQEITEERIINFFSAHCLSIKECRALPVLLSAASAAVICENPDDDELIVSAVKNQSKLREADFPSLFYALSKAERYLCDDPSGVYVKMNEETKGVYRLAVSEGAEKQGISENEFAKSALERAKNAENGKNHIGFFLPVKNKSHRKGVVFLISEAMLAVLLSGLLSFTSEKPFAAFLLLLLPVGAALRPFFDRFSAVLFPPDKLLSLDEEEPIGEDRETLIAVSSILPCAADAGKLEAHLSEVYSANAKGCVRLMLLCDLKNSSQPESLSDEADIAAAKRLIDSLNKKHGGGFILAVRDRVYSQTEDEYTGYERKRGALCTLFKLLRDGGESGFRVLYGDKKKLAGVKYVMALDSDTSLSFEVLRCLTAAAQHPLNRPVVDLSSRTVKSGYGIIAPRVETSLISAQKTVFSRIFTNGGSLSYSPAVHEKYMDMFGETIFTGKGLIDVEAFNRTAVGRFEEQRILSHDILEGAILRTAFAGSCELTDSFPSNAKGYFLRLHRWIRGDVQNLKYIFRPLSHAVGAPDLPVLTKYQLIDNFRRALSPVSSLVLLILSCFSGPRTSFLFSCIALLSVSADKLYSFLVSASKSGMKSLFGLYFSSEISTARKDVLMALIAPGALPQTAFVSCDAIIRAGVRSLLTHKRLLSWTPAAQTDLFTGKKLFSSLFFPLLVFVVLFVFGSAALRLVSLLILFYIPLSLSDGIALRPQTQKPLTEREKLTLSSFAGAAWRYFEENVTAEDNYLPPDNVQETPVPRKARRTSPTNIGLYLVSVLAAADLSFISADEMLARLSQTLDAVERLPKYRGLLYNWYDTRKCLPLSPAYVSTVDCGNYLVCITALKQGLREYVHLQPDIIALIKRTETILRQSDLSFLYDRRRNLFRIGFDVSAGEASSSFYDLYMSEARMTSYYAVARRSVPVRHWSGLDRTLKRNGRYVTAASWTGTMFEFFMPTLFLKTQENSFQSEALNVCLYVQKKWAEKRNIPFGVSESCFYDVDSSLSYRYKAHGIKTLALKRKADEEKVISPYSTFLVLPFDKKAAMKNLAALSALHCEGRCGFYEAVDFTHSRLEGEDYAIVRAYMAHHVGMSIIAMANALTDNIFVRRFMSDADMCSAELLLQEKIPAHPVGSSSLREPESFVRPRRPEKNCGRDAAGENRDVYAYSNGEVTLICSIFGENRTLYSGAEMFRFSERSAGISIGVKTENGTVVLAGKGTEGTELKKYAFTAGKTVGELRIQAAVMVHPSEPALLLPVRITNLSGEAVETEIIWYSEPNLQPFEKADMHPAFSDMFLRTENLENINAVVCSRVNAENAPSAAIGFYGKNSFSVSLSREDILSRKLDAKSVFDMNFAVNTSMLSCVSPAAAFSSKLRLGPHKSGEYVLVAAFGGNISDAKHRLMSVRNGQLPTVSKGAAAPFLRDALTFAGACDFLSCAFFNAVSGGIGAAAAAAANKPLERLWSCGISGDYPLITVFAQKNCSPSLLRSFVRLHKRLNRCGIKNDIVFVYGKNADYSFSGEQTLLQALRDEALSDSIGKKAGVHILLKNNLSSDALTALLAFSCLIFPENRKKVLPEAHFCIPVIPAVSENKGENGFFCGGYFIGKHPRLPWCHTLSNPSFGTLLTDRSLGFTWALNSRQNKLTPWSNDSSSDLNGERLFLKTDGKIYDCVNVSNVYFFSSFAEYQSVCGGFKVKTVVYVPEKGMEKRVSVTVENIGAENSSFSLFYCVFPVMGEDGRYDRFLKYRSSVSSVTVCNAANSDFFGFMRIVSDADGARAVTDTENFTGFKRKCAGVVKELTAQAGCRKQTDFFMRFARCEKALDSFPVLPFPDKKEEKVIFHTFSPELNEFASSLLLHQVRDTRLFARTGFYQCSGAYGFRDQLQDILPLIGRDNNSARRIILRFASVQFPDGDVLHWFHPIFRKKMFYKGTRTRCSDDRLWLPLAVAEYVVKTGDAEILEAQLPFLSGDLLPAGTNEAYGEYEASRQSASLYSHCLRAVFASLKTGAHSLPLIGSGDWNDSFNLVGEAGEGESVWLAMFLRYVCIKFAKICRIKGDTLTEARLLTAAKQTAAAADEYAWNGSWYVRGFYDDGTALGDKGNGECEIDLLCQAWSVLSDMPDKNRRKKALTSAYERLFDEKAGVVRLFFPPFSRGGKRTGYVNLYPGGMRENGGQYTHAAVWFAAALFRENMISEGEKVLDALLPNVKYAQRRGNIYKTEPYALCGDVYSAKGLEGRGGWSLYTGSAGWLLTLADELDGKTLLRKVPRPPR